MRLALFDLDHTLIPFDSGMAWLRFLAGRAAIPAEAEAGYLALCQQLVAGRPDIHAMHRALVRPLVDRPAAAVAGWLEDFEAAMHGRLFAPLRTAVQQHLEAGDLCALVTASPRPIAEPFAQLAGIEQVVATESRRHGDAYTGEVDGLPCFREHKPVRVAAWLAARGETLADFERSWFYSDAASDLPLLQAVSDPVAVRPDARLREAAAAGGWRLIEAG